MQKDYFAGLSQMGKMTEQRGEREGMVTTEVPTRQHMRDSATCTPQSLSPFQNLFDCRPRTPQLGADPTGPAGAMSSAARTARGHPAVFAPANCVQEDPPPLLAVRSSSARIHALFAEVIEELESRMQECEGLERFPQLEDYIGRKTVEKGDAVLCKLCGDDVRRDARWHFECTHYDEFLYWLEVRAALEGKRRRQKLIRHRKALKERKSLKN